MQQLIIGGHGSNEIAVALRGAGIVSIINDWKDAVQPSIVDLIKEMQVGSEPFTEAEIAKLLKQYAGYYIGGRIRDKLDIVYLNIKYHRESLLGGILREMSYHVYQRDAVNLELLTLGLEVAIRYSAEDSCCNVFGRYHLDGGE